MMSSVSVMPLNGCTVACTTSPSISSWRSACASAASACSSSAIAASTAFAEAPAAAGFTPAIYALGREVYEVIFVGRRRDFAVQAILDSPERLPLCPRLAFAAWFPPISRLAVFLDPVASGAVRLLDRLAALLDFGGELLPCDRGARLCGNLRL